jgi:NADH-quinone oxidoreductase subunit M
MEIPPQMLSAVGAMALLGALYSSCKALAQVHLPELAAHASAAFYSIFWWCLAVNKSYGSEAVLYVLTVILLTVGLLLAWQRLQHRYGNLTLERMHGLAKPMPCFSTLFALLVMAAVGLPPFGFFSSHLAMLTQASSSLSSGFPIVMLVWFMASWYLFRMMQRLLFGPHREDFVYQDLRAGEVVTLASVLVAVLLLGAAPRQSAPSERTTYGERAVRETITWQK